MVSLHKTRLYFKGACIKLAGAVVAYSPKLQPTVAVSSTEFECMGVHDTRKLFLCVLSVMWDMYVPREAARKMYEDNDDCMEMANAQKPTTRTRHMYIWYHSLYEWVKCDLIKLERVDTSINLAYNFTKSLTITLFN